MRISDWSSDVCSSDLLNIALNQASFRPVADLRGRVRVMGAECQLFRRLPGPAASSVKREIQWSISRSAFGEAEMPTLVRRHNMSSADRKSTRLNSSH